MEYRNLKPPKRTVQQACEIRESCMKSQKTIQLMSYDLTWCIMRQSCTRSWATTNYTKFTYYPCYIVKIRWPNAWTICDNKHNTSIARSSIKTFGAITDIWFRARSLRATILTDGYKWHKEAVFAWWQLNEKCSKCSLIWSK